MLQGWSPFDISCQGSWVVSQVAPATASSGVDTLPRCLFSLQAISLESSQLQGRPQESKISGMKDPFHLQRFVDAQSGVIDQVYAELRAGQKRSHWMWFIFPQIRGLGSSRMAQEFAISSLTEATAYVAHPVLGPRLRASTELVNAIEGRSTKEILGYPDHLKFHSSMTLFARADPDELVFHAALQKFFGGNFDQSTLDRLR